MVTSVHTAPAAPELYKHNNGIWVVRYPFQTKKGSTVARTYKIGWGEEKAQAQFKVFMTHWSKMNGKGPDYVIRAMTPKPKMTRKVKANPHAGRSLVVAPAKTYKLTEEQRKAARDKYAKRKSEGKIVRGRKAPVQHLPNVSELGDLVGMLISSVNTFSLTLKMLQERLHSMQPNVKQG